jgi:hypothetical protein
MKYPVGLSAMMGIGVIELIIIASVGLLLIGGIVVFVFMLGGRRD